MLPYTEHYFLKAVTGSEPIGAIEPSPDWTEELLDWGEGKTWNAFGGSRLPAGGHGSRLVRRKAT
jgi:hypothetical protein